MDIVDEEGNILYMSDKFTKIFGNRAIGKKCWSLYKDDKKQCKMCPLKKDVKADISGRVETEGALGGKSFHITHTNIKYKGENALLEVFNDITALKTTANLLQNSNREINLILSSIPSIIIGLTNDFKVGRWNTSAESIIGIAASDVIGRPFRECGIQWNWDEVFEKISLCQESNCATWIEDFKYKRPDESYGFFGITINTIRNEVDEQSGILLLMKDITERKNIEQQLMHSQKLEAIGELAAGIAHEINTPTQFISDNTFFIQDAFSKIIILLNKYTQLQEMNKAGLLKPELINELDDMIKDINLGYLVEEIPVAIEETQNGLRRVTEIVKSIKTFSHPDTKEKVSVDINKMIMSTVTVSKNEWKYVAEMETNFDDDMPPVPCYPGEFNQVVLNLIINAAHTIGEASGNGNKNMGKISISTRHDGDWAEIRISDTGTGIPEKIRSRIFEPFFTTKEVGKGTGQGLSITHSVVVKKHNGQITFDTVTGKGTTFIIRLPI
jgi:PAS domain S-box-containing protein